MSVRDAEGITHIVRVEAETLFEAAALGIAAFREQGWAAGALTPNAVLRIEVHLPTVVHEVPLKSVERWAASSEHQPEGASGETAAPLTGMRIPVRCPPFDALGMNWQLS